ncbi:hypothetical protein [Catenovulum adriaticum]|uniref:Apea-like HEPN domain-containing protein n=1 Tax=Catenovulum adriaticum TaxID=2984846 RepID=A0ABY7AMT5_9ALTE|nr:hypothetical protein [Catenovulum sp. TS8]WAJ70859.1 hypothetical protein OLW01_03345 [Catenovulum sp. TS8]
MFKEVDGEIKQTRASNIDKLLKVLVSQEFERAEYFKLQYQKYNGQIPIQECDKWNNSYLICQTFTAMILEAFYYDYLFEKESKDRADKKCKQPLARFVYLAKTYLNQPEIEKSDLYFKLEALNKLRRHWVHHKSTKLGKYSNPEQFFSPSECISLIIEVLSIFEKYDDTYILSSIIRESLISVQEDVENNINSIKINTT